MNHKCYKFKKITLANGIMDFFVDATYVITLENSPRMKSVYNQLYEFKPTTNIFILINKGFKKCKKNLFKQTTNHDLIDANLQIFLHAKKNNYKNILVLEDDFIFNNEIKKNKHLSRINNFINKKNKENVIFTYNLGVLNPYPLLPFFNNHYRYFLGGGTHGMIYTKKFYNFAISQIKDNKINDIDKFQIKDVEMYTYKIPLCAQTVIATENSITWVNSMPWKLFTKLFNLPLENKQNIFKTYQRMFNLGKIIFIIIISFLIYVLYRRLFKN